MVNVPHRGHGNSLLGLSQKAMAMGILEMTPSLLLPESQSTPGLLPLDGWWIHSPS